jgi:nicotinate-nucleotide--dimethylbenzimidazole phosphoribosyltransferase
VNAAITAPEMDAGAKAAVAVDWDAAARAALDDKTKPVGSLGYLEDVARRLCSIQRTTRPTVERARVVVFAGDHGVVAEGVSAYPAAVTGQMMHNFAGGGAAVCVLARAAGAEVEVVDVGVDADLPQLAGVVHARVRRGTRNLRREPAMHGAERDAAMEAGRAAVRRAARDSVQAVALGEMGIGNTTAAAALLAALTRRAAADTVGAGTGVCGDALDRKRAVVDAALARHADVLGDPANALAALGGLEIAAIAGAVLEAAGGPIAIVVDGFISTVGALAAVRMQPAAAANLFFAHRSAEHGHALALEALGARPLLDLGMRLGEGSGAALALPILRAAARIMTEMATFSGAGVSREGEA